jgi:DNA-binding NarL/FixJ family response regulator
LQFRLGAQDAEGHTCPPYLDTRLTGRVVESGIVVGIASNVFSVMSKSEQIRVLVVDDHPVVRAGLASMLSCYPELQVAIGKSRVDVVLLDLRMPEMSGLETLQAIRLLEPAPKVIVLTSYETDEDIYQAILAGADGYLLKASSDEEMLDAIRSAMSGQRYFPPYIASRFAECAPRASLSSSEIELLDLLAGSAPDSEIASHLGIKKRFVWERFDKILEKLIDEEPPGNAHNTVAPRITIEEVARKAGVSISTVSRVLHNKGNHTEETRAAVMRVVREYGFELNRTAASLAMRRGRINN